MNDARPVAYSNDAKPVAWMHVSDTGHSLGVFKNVVPALQYLCVPLYRQPQPILTDDERAAVGRAAALIRDTLANDSKEAMGDYMALRGLFERTGGNDG